MDLHAIPNISMKLCEFTTIWRQLLLHHPLHDELWTPPIVGMYCSILFQHLSPHPNNKNPDIPTAWRTSRPFMVMLWRSCKLKRQCSCQTRGWDFHLAHGVEKPTFSRQRTPICLYLFDGNYVYFLFKGDDICKSTPRNNQTKIPMVY